MTIRIHKKYGLNPSITQCYFCLGDKDIILPGSRTKAFKDAGIAKPDGEMPMKAGVLDKEPCQKCEEYMEDGVILISVRDGEEGNDPYRTGGWIVIKEEAITRMELQPPELVEHILKYRSCFMHDAVWDHLGLPRGEVEGVPSE